MTKTDQKLNLPIMTPINCVFSNIGLLFYLRQVKCLKSYSYIINFLSIEKYAFTYQLIYINNILTQIRNITEKNLEKVRGFKMMYKTFK